MGIWLVTQAGSTQLEHVEPDERCRDVPCQLADPPRRRVNPFLQRRELDSAAARDDPLAIAARRVVVRPLR